MPPFDFANHVNLASFADVATTATMNNNDDDGPATTIIHPSLKDHLRYEHPLVQRYVATLCMCRCETLDTYTFVFVHLDCIV